MNSDSAPTSPTERENPAHPLYRGLVPGADVPRGEEPASYSGFALMALRTSDGTVLAVWDGNGELHAARSDCTITVHDSANSLLGDVVNLLNRKAGR